MLTAFCLLPFALSSMFVLCPYSTAKHTTTSGRTLPTPKAIVVISSHWEEREIKVTSGAVVLLCLNYFTM
jgi:aromatic ring-opening dioxygenase catalytic subunit (LigB family)